MKKILKNLIPPAFYWITFAVGFLLFWFLICRRGIGITLCLR